METLLSRSFNIRHLGPHNQLVVYRKRSATRPTLEKQSVSSFIHFNGKPAFLSTARPNGGHEHENQFINRNQIDKVGSPSKWLGHTVQSYPHVKLKARSTFSSFTIDIEDARTVKTGK